MQAMRLYDLTTLATANRPLDLAPLEGTWVKTNSASQWLGRLEIAARGDALQVSVFGDEDGTWGSRRADSVYAAAIDSTTGAAFIVRYDLGAMECTVEGNVNLGLLVVACFTRFKDGSNRADCFTREFFHRC